MAGKDPRFDAYIKRAAPFARPILKHLRKVVHAGRPDVDETIKWNSPFFEHKGIICLWPRSRSIAFLVFGKAR